MSVSHKIHSAVLRIYSGEQPESVERPVTGALIAVAGFPNGIPSEEPVTARIVANGTARYGRLYVNDQPVADWSMADMGLAWEQPVDWSDVLTFKPSQVTGF